MKTNQNKRQLIQNWKDCNRLLDKIQLLIKKSETRELGYQLLSQINAKTITPRQKVHCLYLNARYSFYCYKEDKDTEHLEIANDFLDDMNSIIYKEKVVIKDLRLLFTRAYVKLQLAHLIWDEERKPWLLEKAKHITDIILRYDSKNESFLWLKQQLSNS